jgi:predicted DNA-binding protein (MmcQ/YjbR family)
MAFPGVHEDFPWGERVMKVNRKVFVFLGKDDSDDEGIGLSVKLPHSSEAALELPFTEPTGYGLGKAGWVSAHFDAAGSAPLDMIKEWIAESYRAVAPKKLIAALDGRARMP